MPSYISNSDQAIPEGNWTKNISVSLAIVVCLLLAAELFLRSAGFVPSLNDDADLWCYTRSNIKGHNPQEVVLIGASRMQLGLNPAVFRRINPGPEVTVLTVRGNTDCRTIFEEIAKDPSFCGTLIVDFYESLLVEPSTLGPDESVAVKAYVDRFTTWNRFDSINEGIRLLFQSAFVTANSDSLKILARSLLSRKPAIPPYAVTFTSRYTAADFSRSDATKLKQSSIGPKTIDSSMVSKQIEKLEAMVSRIQDRGGRVVFVTMPTSNRAVRRQDTWDVLAAGTKALSVHFQDYPDLARFTCPDTSHLDYRDAERFTASFASILKRKIGTERQLARCLCGKCSSKLAATRQEKSTGHLHANALQ